MSYRVTLARRGVSFTVKPQERILDAALTQGVKMVYACRNGTCKACMVQVLEGEIHNDPVQCPTLFPHERQAGKRLICVGTCESDVKIDR